MLNDEEINSLLEYLSIKMQHEKLQNRINRLDTLVNMAQKKLSLSELDRISQDILTLTREMSNLELKRMELLKTMNEKSPEYVFLMNESKKIVKMIEQKLYSVAAQEITLIEFNNWFASIHGKLLGIINKLRREERKLANMIENKKVPIEYMDPLEREISLIKKLIDELETFSKMVSPNLKDVKKGWDYVGLPVVDTSTYRTLGMISDVVISIPNMDVLLEVSKEKEISSSVLDALFKLYKDEFGASDIESFYNKLLMTIKSNTDFSGNNLTPTIITRFFSLRGIYLDKNLKRILKPEYSKVGYLPLTKISKETAEQKITAKKEDIIVNNLTTVPAPSIHKIPENFIGSEIAIGNYTYKVYCQTWAPTLGTISLLLRLDENREPLPDLHLIRKVLKIAIKVKKQDKGKYRQLLIAKKSKSPDDIYWAMRLAIVTGLRDYRDIAENQALRPSNIFTYCLKNKIPVVYPEIIESYFTVIKTSRFRFSESTLSLKQPIQIFPLRTIFNREFISSLTRKIFNDVLGIIIRKAGGIYIQGTPAFDFKELINSDLKIPSAVIKFAKKSIKKLVKGLIFTGIIKSPADYRYVLNKLSVQEISYNEVIKGFNEDPRYSIQLQIIEKEFSNR